MGRGIAKTAIMLNITAATIMMLISGIASETYVVGGDGNKWSVPSSPDFYEKWAAQHNFTIGDNLVFDFETDDHTVAILKSKATYDKCDTDVIEDSEIRTEGPLNLTLTSSDQFYFLCTIGGGRHCKRGLKFAASVAAARS